VWFGEVDIPIELVKAAQSGELVLFVGAGASIAPPASLPGFAGLVSEIVDRTRTVVQEQDATQFDRILGRVEDTGVDVHRLVAQAVDRTGSAPNQLHRSIINVARSHPSVRIVTTNYDHHLTTAAADAGLTLEIYRAPAVPTGDDFEGVVHLHGALNQDPRHLIVTDRDFGRAYLRDAWAARFAERMFARFTVAFIGYSHGDVVLSYLARSLTRAGTRFIFTSEPDKPEWRTLGITPVPYPTQGRDHSALHDSLDRWATTASMGLLDHRRRITSLVQEGPPQIPEDISYLEECLSHPQRTRFFTHAASEPEWLTWVAERPQYGWLFDQRSETVEDPEITSTLTTWVVNSFVLNESHTAAALALLMDRPWTDRTRTLITSSLVGCEDIETWHAPWVHQILQRTPATYDSETLDLLLTHHSWPHHLPLAIAVLEHQLRPVLTTQPSFDDRVSYEVRLAGSEDWLTKAWTTLFKPALGEHALELLDLVIGQLRALYRVHRTIHDPASTWDPYSFDRSAIEEGDDTYRQSTDVLIDAARDCLEHLLRTAAPAVAGRLEEWLDAKEAVLRRLALHGLRLSDDLASADRLRRVADRRRLYDFDAQHETYALLAQDIPHADAELTATLLQVVRAGPTQDFEDERTTAYARYNLLVWLAQHAPDSAAIVAELHAEQQANPDFSPRERPDLSSHMTGGLVEDAEPFTAEELHQRFAAGPAQTLDAIRSYRHEGRELRLTGPTWTGAFRAVRAWVQRYPDDGISATQHLLDNDTDLRIMIINGWGLSTLSQDQIGRIVAIIGSWDLEQIRWPAARMLTQTGTHDGGTHWHTYPAARTLAATLWTDQPVEGGLRPGGDDISTEALNHPAGSLAEFWTKATSYDWQEAGDDWAGIPGELRAQLNRIVDARTRSGLLGRVILAPWLRFYHGADAEWAITQLFRHFDWDTNPDEAAHLWKSFLAWGHFDDRLLGAGLLTAYLDTCTHEDALSRRGRSRLAGHFAAIAVLSAADIDNWLTDFIATASDQLREDWASRVAKLLRELTPEQAAQQWEHWIRAYWTDRVASLPRPLTATEASQTTRWVIGLPRHRPEAVDLACRTDASLSDGRLLHDIHEADLTDDPSTWVRLLTHCAHNTEPAPLVIHHYLQKIIATLRAAEPGLDLTALIEEALRLGVDQPDVQEQ
jgi:hypothetical protein